MIPLRVVACAIPAACVFAAVQAGRPGFQNAPGSPYAVGDSPADVALGDINNDNHLDIVTANGRSGNLSALLGDGRGSFGPAPGFPLPAGAGVHLVAIADLNADRNRDLIASAHDSDAVHVFIGDGTGRFIGAMGSPFRALQTMMKPHNHGLAVGDVNRDGRPDIATGDQDANAVAILLQTAAGGFEPASRSPFAVGTGPYPIAIADIDGDGNADVVAPNTGSHDISILAGDGSGHFRAAAHSPVAVPTRPYFVAAGDLNGDSRIDVVSTHDDTDVVSLIINDGRNGFRTSRLNLGRRSWAVVPIDMNGDRRADVVAATGDSVSILNGDGRGAFKSAAGSPVPTGDGSWKVAVADLNGDRRPDVVVNNVTKGTVTVLLAK